MAAAWITMMVTTLWAMHYGGAAYDIGMCLGTVADNLPLATDVVKLCKKIGIEKVRLFDPNSDYLGALRGSGLGVTVGVKNQDLQPLSGSQQAVNDWFSSNIQPYLNDVNFTYIAVGNEVIPGKLSQFVLPVMKFLQVAVDQHGLTGKIKISTALPGYALSVSYPPSQGTFTKDCIKDMTEILRFLSENRSPLMINVYPYYAYADDPRNVRLGYALFNSTTAVVKDQGLTYYSLFDTIVDAFFSAMERAGASNVDVVVTESGWPSAGNGALSTPDLASTYNTRFVIRILTNTGTPKRPHAHIEGFLFAMFNENKKAAGIEQNFGLFYPNMQPVYSVFP